MVVSLVATFAGGAFNPTTGTNTVLALGNLHCVVVVCSGGSQLYVEVEVYIYENSTTHTHTHMFVLVIDHSQNWLCGTLQGVSQH